MNLPQIGSRNHKSLPHLIPRQLSSDDYRRPATKRDEYKRRQQQDDWNKIVKADQIAHASQERLKDSKRRKLRQEYTEKLEFQIE